MNITGIAPLLLELQLLVFAELIGCWTCAWYVVGGAGFCAHVPLVVAADAGVTNIAAAISEPSAKLMLSRFPFLIFDPLDRLFWAPKAERPPLPKGS